jgi:hypothetical protein
MEALTPSGNLVWVLFLRGIACGLVGGLVVVILSFLAAGKHPALVRTSPRYLLSFAVGTEIGIALVVTLVFLGLYFLHIHASNLAIDKFNHPQ